MKLSRIAVLALAFLFVACQKPPQLELDAAKQALDGVKAAEAQKYAADQLAGVESAFQAAEAEIATQNEKFALFRNYDNAKKLLAEVGTKAEAARAAAVEGKEQARAAAQAALDGAKAALAAATTQLAELGACPRKPKGFKEDLEALQGQLDGFTAQAGSLDSSFASEDFKGTVTQAESLTQQIQTLAADLTAAKEKIRC